MKTLVCCMLKMENHYLDEWISHYRDLGVDKIVIYDNNDIDGQYAEDITTLNEVIKGVNDHVIDIYKIPGEDCAQLKYYNQCYSSYKEYDWLLFVDIDEFLTIDEKYNTIKDFLSSKRFNEFDMIHLNWKVFDDNDQLYVVNDNYSLKERFTRPASESVKSKGIDREVKSIVRGGIPGLKFVKNPHTMESDSREIRCCDALGRYTSNKLQKSSFVVHQEAWINHYICKTVEEYCKIKLIRLGGHTSHKKNQRYTFTFFFTYNKRTPEKVEAFKKFFYRNNSHRLVKVSTSSIPKTEPHKNSNVKRIKILNPVPKNGIIKNSRKTVNYI